MDKREKLLFWKHKEITMPTPMKIDFVSDVACPWCAIGLASLKTALARLGDEVDADLHFSPFELNPDMPVENTASPNASPVAPKDTPRNERPSSRTNKAGVCSWSKKPEGMKVLSPPGRAQTHERLAKPDGAPARPGGHGRRASRSSPAGVDARRSTGTNSGGFARHEPVVAATGVCTGSSAQANERVAS